MMQLMPHIEGVNQLRICQFLVQVGMLPHTVLIQRMVDAGGIAVMSRMMQDKNERLRREGLLWIANLALDGFKFVELLFDSKALEHAYITIRSRDRPYLVRNAIFAMLNVCKTCLANTMNPRSEDIMGHLIDNYQLMAHTVQYVDVPGCDELTIDILCLWNNAIKWRPAFVIPLLEERGGLDKVSQMLSHRNTKIYKLAVEIDDKTHKREMECGEEPCVAFDPPVGVSAQDPTVYHGGFNF
jgi:hypothetical protein